MIKIADNGNTVISVGTAGSESGTKWTVYPHLVEDPTFQRFTPEQQSRANELSISGIRDKEDLSGHRMRGEMAEAVARLLDNLGLEQYKDLGMVADRIDVKPDGTIAKILKEQYGINSIEQQASPLENKG